MREKRVIEKLDNEALTLEYPQPVDGHWPSFEAGVRHVLRVNDIPGEWEYDPDAKEWFAEWFYTPTELARTLRDQERMTFSATFKRYARFPKTCNLAIAIPRLQREWFEFTAEVDRFCQAGLGLPPNPLE